MPAYTGLALLTFLAHGETPSSKEFGTTVRKAMEWLCSDKIHVNQNYAHAIKAYALAEAYAMTGVSILEDAMNRSIRIIIDGQQKMVVTTIVMCTIPVRICLLPVGTTRQ